MNWRQRNHVIEKNCFYLGLKRSLEINNNGNELKEARKKLEEECSVLEQNLEILKQQNPVEGAVLGGREKSLKDSLDKRPFFGSTSEILPLLFLLTKGKRIREERNYFRSESDS